MSIFKKTPLPRTSGILLHITSLPSKGGVGTLGREAYRFVDFLSNSGMTVWQMLPVGPAGLGESPYQSVSAFAGDLLLIDLEDLIDQGLLEKEDLPKETDGDRIALRAAKEAALRCSYEKHGREAAEFVGIFAKGNTWLSDWALFAALKTRYHNTAWQDWPDKSLVHRVPEALARAQEEFADEIGFHCYVQWLFANQWARLKKYANEHGVRLFGDMPIYASGDSADCWAYPQFFQLDENGRPTHVAGVPPDYFSEDGQRWGNPLYDWKVLKKAKYSWWVDRMRCCCERFDWVRIDHFIGFANYYSIPVSSPTARTGQWIKGPGRPLFRRIERSVPGLKIIAEDLGEVSPRVIRLMRQCSYPGMRLLMFGYGDGDQKPEAKQSFNMHDPRIYPENCIAYTGTHDSDTLAGYLACAEQKALDDMRRRHPGRDDLANALVETLFACRAATVILPMQDLLGLGNEARMNTPGTVGGQNWLWRMDADVDTDALVLKIKALRRRGLR